MFLHHRLRQVLDPRARLVHRQSAGEAPDRRGHEPGAVRGLAERRVPPTGRAPDVDVGLEGLRRVAERWRHHTDDLVDVLVYPELAAEHVRVGPEAAAPQAVADHRDGRDARNLVAHRERAPQSRDGVAEDLEIVGARQQHLDALGSIRSRQVRGDRPDSRNRFERRRPRRVVLELGLRQAGVADVEGLVVRGDAHQRVGVGERQGLQEDAVNDGVDGGRRRHPEGKGPDYGERKERIPPHPPERQPNILHVPAGCTAHAREGDCPLLEGDCPP